MDYCCGEKAKVIKMFDRLYAMHPDTAIFCNSMKYTFINFKLDGIRMCLEWRAINDGKIEIKFINAEEECDVECEDDMTDEADANMFMSVSLRQYRTMGTLMERFIEVFEKVMGED